MGDYNINLMNYENHTLTSDFVDLLHSLSFISLINRPTRITSILLLLYNKRCPKQKVKLKYNTRKMWLTQGLKDAIKNKSKLYKKYLNILSAANEVKYKTYRNKLITSCRKQKNSILVIYWMSTKII